MLPNELDMQRPSLCGSPLECRRSLMCASLPPFVKRDVNMYHLGYIRSVFSHMGIFQTPSNLHSNDTRMTPMLKSLPAFTFTDSFFFGFITRQHAPWGDAQAERYKLRSLHIDDKLTSSAS